MMMKVDDPVYIIGSGISGLGCAHYLNKHGYRSVLLEQGDRLGGRAGCIDHLDRTLELGGKNFASNWPFFNEILQEFKLFEYDRQHPQFTILLNRKLMTFSKKIKLSELPGLIQGIGVKGCLQFLSFLRWVKKNGHRLNYESPFLNRIEKNYDNHPIDHYFSRGLAQGPLRMFSIIMGGAEPEETYYSTLGTLLSGFGKGSHHSLASGLGTMLGKLSEGQEIRYNTTVTAINVENQRVRGLMAKSNQHEVFLPAQNVICATPAHGLRKLIDLPADVNAAVARIRYFPVILVNAEYEKDVFNDRCVSIMFDNRYHLGHCSANRLYQKNRIRFTFSGRRARAVVAKSDEELITLAEKEFASVWPISSPRLFYHVARHAGGMCAYGPNYTAIREKLVQYVDTIDGLALAGDYLNGHNMEHCLESAYRAVQTVVDR
jgi:protoporphyrinogen/coproporphyrinogen III oxidase